MATIQQLTEVYIQKRTAFLKLSVEFGLKQALIHEEGRLYEPNFITDHLLTAAREFVEAEKALHAAQAAVVT